MTYIFILTLQRLRLFASPHSSYSLSNEKVQNKNYVGLSHPNTKEALELFIKNIIDKNK